MFVPSWGPMGRKVENPGKGKRSNKGGWERKGTERGSDTQSKRGERHQQGTNIAKIQDSDRTVEFSRVVTTKPSTIPKAALEETRPWWVLSLLLSQFI